MRICWLAASAAVSILYLPRHSGGTNRFAMPSIPDHALRAACGHPGNGSLMLGIPGIFLNTGAAALRPNEVRPS
jgi:hypothetical protein